MKFIYNLLEIIFLPLSFLFRIIGYSAFVIKESIEAGWKEGWLAQNEVRERMKSK
jgi:hypothetical protein